MKLPAIRNREELIRLVDDVGFLPFFSGPIPGFSIDDAVPLEIWNTYVVPCDFLFPRDEHGEKKYSYGTTVFDIPERWLGEENVTSEYKTEPKESLRVILEHLHRILPEADEKAIMKLIR